ncbi:BrnT family toxin [Jiella pelagia]|uniref:BrnT family toxin n=1 Tax=Jiella pelagia TaxID=2986949 RepID=A0ABY7BUX3_9HYPH|nr:BrnT family toxin [Jiella pelagia]WAP67112.1 BrnT family toxin [Jiella pelagia]
MSAEVSFEWDPAKAEANVAAGRPPFTDVHRFDFATAAIFRDERRNYGEVRKIAIGIVGERHHVLVYTERAGRVRVISFRKANQREVDIHDRYTESVREDGSDR